MRCDWNANAGLGADADDTTASSSTSVASLEGLLVSTLAKVVGAGVDDDGSAKDRVLAKERDELVGDVELDDTLGIRLDVTKVTNVALLVGDVAVLLAGGVEVRAGRGAAVAEVTEGVDVEASLGVGVVAGDLTSDGDGGAFALLGEDGLAGHLSLSLEHSDGRDHCECV